MYCYACSKLLIDSIEVALMHKRNATIDEITKFVTRNGREIKHCCLSLYRTSHSLMTGGDQKQTTFTEQIYNNVVRQ